MDSAFFGDWHLGRYIPFDHWSLLLREVKRPAPSLGVIWLSFVHWGGNFVLFGEQNNNSKTQHPSAFLAVFFLLPDCPGHYFGSDAGGTFSIDGLPGVLNKRGGEISVLWRKHFMI